MKTIEGQEQKAPGFWSQVGEAAGLALVVVAWFVLSFGAMLWQEYVQR